MRAIKTGKLSKLSVQEVIDCSKGFDNLDGCSGGGTCLAFDWMLKVIFFVFGICKVMFRSMYILLYM